MILQCIAALVSNNYFQYFVLHLYSQRQSGDAARQPHHNNRSWPWRGQAHTDETKRRSACRLMLSDHLLKFVSSSPSFANEIVSLIPLWVPISVSQSHACTNTPSVSLYLWSSPSLLPLCKNTGCIVLRRKAHSRFYPSYYSHAYIHATCSQSHKATAHMQRTFPCPPSKQPHGWKIRFAALLCPSPV